MKFPVKVRFRRAEVRIYGKSEHWPYYRVRPMVAGGKMATFRSYSDARAAADKLVREVNAGSRAATLTSAEADAALIAMQRLDSLFRETGKRVALPQAVDSFCAAVAKLGDRPLAEAVDGFLANVASVKRMDLGEAVEKWIESRAPKAQSREGKRAQLSKGYAYNVAMWAREFSGTFANLAVCDLTRGLIGQYFGQHSDVGPKTRNARRGVVRMFIKWAEGQDLLPFNNRILKADAMAREVAEPGEIELYTAKELEAILSTAASKPEFEPMVPVVAVIALGGIRLQEAVRLEWADVWHVDGHIEVSVSKSKTRARRLATICPSLALWLAPYKAKSGPLWTQTLSKFHNDFNALLESLGIKARKNALRHSFVSAHYSLHADEGLTAKESGNSPAVIHAAYRGLLTLKQAEQWFAVAPVQPGNVLQMAVAEAK